MSRRWDVLLHDRLVGRLTGSDSGAVEFRFVSPYRDMVPRPVLSQKFEDDLERIQRNRKGAGLPDFFANLIPEGRLRDLIEKAGHLDAGDDLALLSFVGRDLPGAVVVRPSTEAGSLAGEAEPNEPVRRGAAAVEGEGLRFSLAGVQLKFSMLREGEKLTLPASDHSGEWIVKLDSPSFPQLPENEFSMLEWARASGFDVAECRLHKVDDLVGLPRQLASAHARVLAVRRYDRALEGRVHQEDFAQAAGLPPNRKYDGLTYGALAHLVRRFIDEAAVDEFVRRLVFIIASGNNDAHLKNWSLVYPDTVRATWAPLYDQVATVAWPMPVRTLALSFAGVREFGRLDREAFRRFAIQARIGEERIQELIESTLLRVWEAWRTVSSDLPLPSAHGEAIREHWRKVPLLRSFAPLP